MDVLEVNSVELVKERAGRRRTLRYDIRARRAGEAPRDLSVYGKQYAGSSGTHLFEVMRYLHPVTAPEVRVPEPLAHSRRGRLVLLSELEGTSLHNIMGIASESETRSILVRLGEKIAALHEVAPPVRPDSDRPLLKRHGPRDEVALLDQAAERMAESDQPPQIIVRFRRACFLVRDAILRATQGKDHPKVLVHRDLHPGQILIGRVDIGLIGFDKAAVGEAELDLGNLVANFILWDHQREGAERLASVRSEALLAGYRERRNVDAARLAAYTSSALLRLAAVERVAEPMVSRLGWPLLSWTLIDEAVSVSRTVLA